MKIIKATRLYETWLAAETPVYPPHIRLKHELMRKDLFAFLRATYYRWAQIWPEVSRDLAAAPRVLSVGDLHVENFGTWQDTEGRLVWGINDFDEAYPLAYTNDLVRLAASAEIAAEEGHLSIRPKDTCEAILDGYTLGLKSGGRPLVVEEKHKKLRAMAMSRLRSPQRFWQKLDKQKELKGEAPAEVKSIFARIMLPVETPYRMFRRVSGVGSLGRTRIVAIADWRGGRIAREVKALAPPACAWVKKTIKPRGAFYQSMLDRAVRCPDPFVEIQGNWIVRRLSPQCCRISIRDLPKERDEDHLLSLMGWETANVHLGSPKAIDDVRRDLAKRRADWLHTAAKAMAKAAARDWKEWDSK